MTFGRKERIQVGLIGAALVLILLRLGPFSGDSAAPAVVGPTDSIPTAERQLARRRQLAATVAGKEAVLQKAMAELQAREAGVLKADTAAQAQAQLLDVIRKTATANGIDVRGAEEMRVRPLANDYGEVSVVETFTCGMEQLVNLLADLANQPQILATNEIDVAGGNDKNKKVQVRLSLSGVVPRKLVPKKGETAF